MGQHGDGRLEQARRNRLSEVEHVEARTARWSTSRCWKLQKRRSGFRPAKLEHERTQAAFAHRAGSWLA